MSDVSRNLWRGEAIRLTAIAKEDYPALARWYQDAGFLRLWNADPAKPQTEAEIGKWLEEEAKKQNTFHFAIRPLAGDELLGLLELEASGTRDEAGSPSASGTGSTGARATAGRRCICCWTTLSAS